MSVRQGPYRSPRLTGERARAEHLPTWAVGIRSDPMPRIHRHTAESLFPLTAPTDAQRSLLLAAERLMATKGASVTDRAITTAAGHANKSAIAYHFGSRELLNIAVWDWRGRVVNDRRSILLDDIERRAAT